MWGPDSTDHCGGIPEHEWDERVELSSDQCVIDEAQYFIRGRLEIPTIGEEERFARTFAAREITVTLACNVGSGPVRRDRATWVRGGVVLLAAVILCTTACKRSYTRTAHVELPQGADVREGAPVRFRGFDIGFVQKVTLRRSGAIATLVIQRPDAPIQSNDSVAVHPVGIFGAEAIDIILASSGGHPLRNEDTLHATAPDSLAPMREELARALVHELTERLFHSDSGRRSDSTRLHHP